MMNPELLQAKALLRREMVQRRDAIPADAAESAAARAADALTPFLPGVNTVAVYSAIRSELDPRAAAARLLASGIRLAYPRVNRAKGTLSFFGVADLASLQPGHMGILEPVAESPALPPEAIDAFLVPGLAFDRRGARIGWGKGYYDRTLRAAPGALRVGFAFASQLVENAPVGPADAAMDCVITEAGGVHCGRRAQTE